jgi:dephospho-CoA kinase
MARKPVICLVGGIGSGKSLVAAALARHGGYVIAGDQLGHEALQQADIRACVVERFGSSIVKEDGSIDRRQLGRIVFGDAAALRALEALVFPWIGRRIGEEIAAAQATPEISFIVLDAAVLLEAGWNEPCSRLVFVDAPRDQRLKRLQEQRNWSEKEVLTREHAQMPLNEKQQRADAVVDNSGPPQAVERQVEDLLRKWRLLPA